MLGGVGRCWEGVGRRWEGLPFFANQVENHKKSQKITKNHDLSQRITKKKNDSL